MSPEEVLFILTDKSRATGEEDRSYYNRRFYVRQRGKTRGDGNLSHTRWSRGRSCPGVREEDTVYVLLCYQIH